MDAVITVGVDLAKSVFQVHGAEGTVVVRRRLWQRQVSCKVHRTYRGRVWTARL